MVDEATLGWLMDPDAGPLSPLEELLARPVWQQRAACRGMGTELFFPTRGESTAPAKAICAGCPVREECLDWALAGSLTGRFGIFGGTSERERRKMTTRRKLAKAS